MIKRLNAAGVVEALPSVVTGMLCWNSEAFKNKNILNTFLTPTSLHGLYFIWKYH
jgi:hypothetical protein